MLDPVNIEKLYSGFDSIFSRPTTFHNEGCCVSVEAERDLLTIPRSELTDQMLAKTFGYYVGGSSCFGTFEQFSYFLPRILDVYAMRENGFGFINCYWRAIRGNRDEYERLGLWELIFNTLYAVFKARTERFTILHFHKQACEQKGWNLNYYDLMPSTDMLDDIITEFFYPELSPQPENWERFFDNWADDDNPHRLAHLLDFLKRRWEGRGPKIFVQESIPNDELAKFLKEWKTSSTGGSISDLCTWWNERAINYNLPFPKTFEFRLRSDEYLHDIIGRAEPAISETESPYWRDDLMSAIANRDRDDGCSHFTS